DCAQRVCRIQVSHAPTKLGKAEYEEAAQDRQSRAHEHSRKHEQAKGEEEKHHIEEKRIRLIETENRSVDLLSHVEEPGYGKSINSHSRLKNTVQEEIVFAAIGDFSEEIATDRQSGHKRGQDRGDGIGRIAEDLGKHPGPDDLVNQTRCTGKKETKETNPKEPILLGALKSFRHIIHAKRPPQDNSSTDSKPHHNCKEPSISARTEKSASQPAPGPTLRYSRVIVRRSSYGIASLTFPRMSDKHKIRLD